MLPWFWVTWAVRSCCLNFKRSQPDSSSPYCYGGGKGFQRPVSSTVHLQRELQIRTFARSWRVYRKKGYFPTNSSSLPLSLICIRLAPLCLAAAATALSRALPQVFLLSVTPAGTRKGQCPVPSNATSLRPSLWAWSCLGRSLRVWSGKTFLHGVFNCHLIWV